MHPPNLQSKKTRHRPPIWWILCLSGGLLAMAMVIPWHQQSREQAAGQRLLERKKQDLHHVGHSILEPAAQALLDEDIAAANETLEKLREQPQVLAAALVDSSGGLLAVYDREGLRPARVPRRLDPKEPLQATLQLPVLLADGSLGSIWLVPDLKDGTSVASLSQMYPWIASLLGAALILASAVWLARSRTRTAQDRIAARDTGRKCRQPAIRHTRSIRSMPAPEPQAPAAPKLERNLKLAPQSTVSKTILIAEDHVLNRRVTVALMEREGYSCKVAENGEEALQVLGEGGIDLILMDCQMPVLDGFEATRRIREREQNSTYHVPIIAMTASMHEEDRRRCLAAGMDDFIAKPMNSSDLTRIAAAWIEGVHGAREQSA